MVFFTTPELMEIGGLPFVSPHEKPTRLESLRYYRRVTDSYGLDVHFEEPVASLKRGSDGSVATGASSCRRICSIYRWSMCSLASV